MLEFVIIFFVAVGYQIYFILAYRPRSVKGNAVLITGGGSGIGRRMALIFAELGAKVIIWDVNPTNMSSVKEEIVASGGTCETHKVDVTNRNEVYTTAKKVGDIDILINNAGIVTGKRIMECPDELMQKTIDVNTTAHFWTIKAFLPSMLKRDAGHIVTVSSCAGLCGVPSMVDYCASKFGAFGLHESLYFELCQSKSSVRTTIVCPYYINTGMFKGVKSRLIPILDERWVSARIVSGIRKGEERIVMPWVLTFVPMVRVLPSAWGAWLIAKLGVSDSMDDFIGRAQ